MSFLQFNENYELKQILGHGTQSTVRRVVRRDTGQVFIAKIYESFMMKARHEMDMLIRLDHPNIVNFYQVYEEQNCIILILEYMAGGELYDQISQRKRLTEGEVRHFISILLDAVRYCHEMGVIHRDIKPQNLLLTTNGPDATLKLSDFGISKRLISDQLNTICGTPIYMAPEIWKMESYNEKVDIWSIGVVTYYLLSGEYPFCGENTQDLLKSVCFTELRFHQKIWDSISGRAILFLREALGKSKEMRPSADELLNNIWFVQPPPMPMPLLDPNLFEAIINISREKIKTKRVRQERELLQILNGRSLAKARYQFLTFQSMGSPNSFSEMESEETEMI